MHRASDWGCDFVCVRRVLFRPLHVFFVVRLANREILHFELTRHPTEGWAALLAVTFRGNSDPSVTLAAWDWGPMLAARHVWRELGRAWPERRDATPLSDRALVLVANQLAAPGSEAGLPTARIVEKPPTGCGARCSRTVRSLRAAGSDADQCHG
jgi:hypothetical protein